MPALSKKKSPFSHPRITNPVVTAKQHNFKKQNFSSEAVFLNTLVKSHQNAIETSHFSFFYYWLQSGPRLKLTCTCTADASAELRSEKNVHASCCLMAVSKTISLELS